MPFSLNEIQNGSAVPAIVAAILLLIVRRLLPRDLGERYGSAMPALAGFLTGYCLLNLAPWVPATHWHWMPYALIAASIAGPVACADGVKYGERALLFGVVAAITAWFFVPTWEDLDPSRRVYLIGMVAYIVGLACLLEPLSQRLPGPLLPAVLWLTLTAAAIVLALSGSLRFAQIGLTGAAPFLGISLAAWADRKANHLTGVGLLFAVLSVGALSIGQVNSFSSVPLVAYVIIPVAPLTLWLTMVGPLAKLTGARRWAVNALLPIAVLASGILLAVVAEGGGESH